jgi:hypothetical protein
LPVLEQHLPDWYDNLSNWECREEPLPYKRGNEEPLVAGSLQAAEDIVIRIEAAVAGIVSMAASIAVTVNTLSEEQEYLFRVIKDYRIAHRSLHLDYFAFHNLGIQERQVLPVNQVRL